MSEPVRRRPRRPNPLQEARRRQKAETDAYFALMCEQQGLPLPAAEHEFHPERKWRFDYAWPEHRVALEVEGGVWTGGRHTRPSGYLGDLEKYSEAAILGWCVVRIIPEELWTTKTIALLKRALGSAGGA